MRFLRIASVFSCVLLCAAVASSQSASSGSSQAAYFLQQSLVAQTGGAAIADLTINGTVSFIRGTHTETGPMTLTAVSVGTSEVIFRLPSGTRTEVWSTSTGTPMITGSGPNGSSSEQAGASVAMPSPAWFSPALLTGIVSGNAYSDWYIGRENWNGQSAQHVAAWQASLQDVAGPPPSAQTPSRGDLYLNSATGLPISMVFRVRPSVPPGSSRPLSIRARPVDEEVRYSEYHVVQGRNIPFLIQLFLGEAPNQIQIMELSVSSVAINTGVAIGAE
jgi:hypothetical protein